MSLAVLLKVVSNGKYVIYPSLDNGEANLLYSLKEMLLTGENNDAATWVNLRNFVLSEKPEGGKVHTEHTYLHEVKRMKNQCSFNRMRIVVIYL